MSRAFSVLILAAVLASPLLPAGCAGSSAGDEKLKRAAAGDMDSQIELPVERSLRDLGTIIDDD